MSLNKLEKPYIVENIEFKVEEKKIEDFLKKDYEVWTKFLSKQPGFIKKETWVSRDVSGNIITIVHWKDFYSWKKIETNELIKNSQEFSKIMGEENFKILELKYKGNQYVISHIWEKKGVNFNNMGESFKLNVLEKPYAIEELIFKTTPENLEKFINLDYEIWTKELSKNESFIRKEIWISKTVPGEVRAVIYWNDYDKWKAIDHSSVDKIRKVFDEKMGVENYSFIDGPHVRNQFFKANFVRR